VKTGTSFWASDVERFANLNYLMRVEKNTDSLLNPLKCRTAHGQHGNLLRRRDPAAQLLDTVSPSFVIPSECPVLPVVPVK
jgi:hypothetical protein